MTDLLTLLANFLKSHASQAQDTAQWYLACSGGRDSMALAFACVLLHKAGKLDYLPTLIHVNHNLQRSSDLWADFVVQFAKCHHLPCQVVSVDVCHHSENGARQARYQAFFEVMSDGDAILLAHHADDQAETMLMRLINGTGLHGLTAMKPVQIKRNINQDGTSKAIKVYRPWLFAGRDLIDQFCQTHQLQYIDDPTNFTGKNTRSILRQNVLPNLYKLNPKFTQNFAKASCHLGQIDEFITHHVDQAIEECVQVRHTFESQLCIDKLNCHHSAIIPLIIQRFIQGDEIAPCGSQLIDDITHLITRNDGDHATRLFWQGVKDSFVFMRYDNVLYRLNVRLWQALQGDFMWQDGYFISKIDNAIVFNAPKTKPRPLAKTDKVIIKHRALSGKKLYQTVRIAPWLRRHLWLDGDHLMSLGVTWSSDLVKCYK
ncbi:tRNA lysidine(34) synthetase TilS [Moraxella nasovis]|uniref:tRNA lysidine(34) synthetase TilS n=1 Tax=Moraxella nasovis TaxID=2904121 RepID=UPI001F619784|nr:tRNA lysidine(34) synthetase TilS [Moraxella nasovis]UNU73932.1 tRNA lysidine(34) synthetase TilS [Moraxella nasovis]